MKFLPNYFAICVLGLLAGCENNATSYMVGGDRDHALTLVREQNMFWSNEVKQEFVIARFPECQRRYPIAPGKTDALKIELYAGAKPMLFIAHQGNDWYALSTEVCQLQKFPSQPAAPGKLLGSYEQQNGKVIFKPVANNK